MRWTETKGMAIMTKLEAVEKYGIPIDILDEYEHWGFCSAEEEAVAQPDFGDRDIEYLSLIMVLHYVGFSADDAEAYMRLYATGDPTEGTRLRMLEKRRSDTLDEIHLREHQLDKIDYLRHLTKNRR